MVRGTLKNVMLMADFQVATAKYRVRVTGISEGEVKMDAPVFPRSGTEVRIKLPNVGWVSGRVSCTIDTSLILQLHTKIDPAAVRHRVTGSFAPARSFFFQPQVRLAA